MALQVLKGRIAGYKRKREEASIFFDDDREGLGVIAIAAGLAGLSDGCRVRCPHDCVPR